MGSFSTIHWVILWMIVYVFYRAVKSDTRRGPAMYCKSCGHNGPTASKTPGSLGIEIVLWLFLIIPGVIYSIWRMSARKPACTLCGSTDLVPTDSPVAAAAQRQLNGD